MGLGWELDSEECILLSVPRSPPPAALGHFPVNLFEPPHGPSCGVSISVREVAQI